MKFVILLIMLCAVFMFSFTNKQSTSHKQFKEPLTTAVFTTKFIVIDKHDITLIKHNSEDGSWEFFSDDKFDNYEKIAKVISLKQIIKADNSILNVSDMKVGCYAHRKSKKDGWIIEPIVK